MFKDEAELRRLWGNPSTRQALLAGLAERGYGADQLADIQHMIEADDSDLFDVLAYVAYAQAPITRADRVSQHRSSIMSDHHDANLQTFLSFVLDQYVEVGVDELGADKLPSLLMLKYRGITDAAQQLGSVGAIRDAFVGFQHRLYE